MDAWGNLPGTSGDAWERMCGTSGDAWERLEPSNSTAWEKLVTPCYTDAPQEEKTAVVSGGRKTGWRSVREPFVEELILGERVAELISDDDEVLVLL